MTVGAEETGPTLMPRPGCDIRKSVVSCTLNPFTQWAPSVSRSQKSLKPGVSVKLQFSEWVNSPTVSNKQRAKSALLYLPARCARAVNLWAGRWNNTALPSITFTACWSTASHSLQFTPLCPLAVCPAYRACPTACLRRFPNAKIRCSFVRICFSLLSERHRPLTTMPCFFEVTHSEVTSASVCGSNSHKPACQRMRSHAHLLRYVSPRVL